MAVQPDSRGSILTKTVTMIGGNVFNKALGSILMPMIGKKIIQQDVQRIKDKLETPA
jgi:hypothetical protein